jgi:uncharacterized protein YbjT (DUF2867 family)
MTDAATTGTETGRGDRLFLVTGATGKTGSGTVRLPLERGHRARAMVHREDKRSRALAEAGAEKDQYDLVLLSVKADTAGPRGLVIALELSPLPSFLVQGVK